MRCCGHGVTFTGWNAEVVSFSFSSAAVLLLVNLVIMSPSLRGIASLGEIFRSTTAADCDDILKTWSKEELEEFAEEFDVCIHPNASRAEIRGAIVQCQSTIRERMAASEGKEEKLDNLKSRLKSK